MWPFVVVILLFKGHITASLGLQIHKMGMPNLPDYILTQILEIVGAEAAWRLGPFLKAGKLFYGLVNKLEFCGSSASVRCAVIP